MLSKNGPAGEHQHHADRGKHAEQQPRHRGERQQEGEDDQVEEEDAGLEEGVRLDEVAGAVGVTGGSARHSLVNLAAIFGGGEGIGEFEGLPLKREEPRGDGPQDEFGEEQIPEKSGDEPAFGGDVPEVKKCGDDEKDEVGKERDGALGGGLEAVEPGALALHDDGGQSEEKGVETEGDGLAGVADQSGKKGGDQADALGELQGDEGDEEAPE